MDSNKKKKQMRLKRHRHIRKKLEGTPERPRLSVFRSNKHIYAQVIDDWNAATLLSFSTVNREEEAEFTSGSNIEAAAQVGKEVGQRCLKEGINNLVFDRGGYKYHGRVKALADGVREVFESEGTSKVFR